MEHIRKTATAMDAHSPGAMVKFETEASRDSQILEEPEAEDATSGIAGSPRATAPLPELLEEMRARDALDSSSPFCNPCSMWLPAVGSPDATGGDPPMAKLVPFIGGSYDSSSSPVSTKEFAASPGFRMSGSPTAFSLRSSTGVESGEQAAEARWRKVSSMTNMSSQASECWDHNSFRLQQSDGTSSADGMEVPEVLTSGTFTLDTDGCFIPASPVKLCQEHDPDMAFTIPEEQPMPPRAPDGLPQFQKKTASQPTTVERRQDSAATADTVSVASVDGSASGARCDGASIECSTNAGTSATVATTSDELSSCSNVGDRGGVSFPWEAAEAAVASVAAVAAADTDVESFKAAMLQAIAAEVAAAEEAAAAAFAQATSSERPVAAGQGQAAAPKPVHFVVATPELGTRLGSPPQAAPATPSWPCGWSPASQESDFRFYSQESAVLARQIKPGYAECSVGAEESTSMPENATAPRPQPSIRSPRDGNSSADHGFASGTDATDRFRGESTGSHAADSLQQLLVEFSDRLAVSLACTVRPPETSFTGEPGGTGCLQAVELEEKRRKIHWLSEALAQMYHQASVPQRSRTQPSDLGSSDTSFPSERTFCKASGASLSGVRSDATGGFIRAPYVSTANEATSTGVVVHQRLGCSGYGVSCSTSLQPLPLPRVEQTPLLPHNVMARGSNGMATPLTRSRRSSNTTASPRTLAGEAALVQQEFASALFSPCASSPTRSKSPRMQNVGIVPFMGSFDAAGSPVSHDVAPLQRIPPTVRSASPSSTQEACAMKPRSPRKAAAEFRMQQHATCFPTSVGSQSLQTAKSHVFQPPTTGLAAYLPWVPVSMEGVVQQPSLATGRPHNQEGNGFGRQCHAGGVQRAGWPQRHVVRSRSQSPALGSDRAPSQQPASQSSMMTMPPAAMSSRHQASLSAVARMSLSPDRRPPPSASMVLTSPPAASSSCTHLTTPVVVQQSGKPIMSPVPTPRLSAPSPVRTAVSPPAPRGYAYPPGPSRYSGCPNAPASSPFNGRSGAQSPMRPSGYASAPLPSCIAGRTSDHMAIPSRCGARTPVPPAKDGASTPRSPNSSVCASGAVTPPAGGLGRGHAPHYAAQVGRSCRSLTPSPSLGVKALAHGAVQQPQQAPQGHLQQPRIVSVAAPSPRGVHPPQPRPNMQLKQSSATLRIASTSPPPHERKRGLRGGGGSCHKKAYL